MLKNLNRNLRRLCSKLRWPVRRRSKPKIFIKKLGKSGPKTNGPASIHPNTQSGDPKPEFPIRIATFNAALFSMAPALPPTAGKPPTLENGGGDYSQPNPFVSSPSLRSKSMIDRPKGILKQSPLHSSSARGSENSSKQQKYPKSKLRVSINLPDNEISLKRSGLLPFEREERGHSASEKLRSITKGKAPLGSPASYGANGIDYGSKRSVLEVLRELDADILALQDVKAEEERGMKPLSDLAAGLGMNYVFAESWAPEYGNAVLSRWPIKRWKVQKIFDDSDFRNVLKTTIDVPQTGEVDFLCTHLDHLDESWRMKQINAIIGSNDRPHILAGGLNSLEETDYLADRWKDIVKFYEEMGKPTPKVEVMKYLKNKQYTDAKDFAGECESVVVIAKGQKVQGTCKYGTRVDYILASADSPYKFMPGSYAVVSSKGTSDHHIVRVDVKKVRNSNAQLGCVNGMQRNRLKQRVVKISDSNPTKGVWSMQTMDR